LQTLKTARVRAGSKGKRTVPRGRLAPLVVLGALAIARGRDGTVLMSIRARRRVVVRLGGAVEQADELAEDDRLEREDEDDHVDVAGEQAG